MTIKITLHSKNSKGDLYITEHIYYSCSNEFVTAYIDEFFHSHGFPYIEIERID